MRQIVWGTADLDDDNIVWGTKYRVGDAHLGQPASAAPLSCGAPTSSGARKRRLGHGQSRRQHRVGLGRCSMGTTSCGARISPGVYVVWGTTESASGSPALPVRTLSSSPGARSRLRQHRVGNRAGSRQHRLGHVDRSAGGTVMAIASAFELFPPAVAPSVKPKPAPSARDWRTGLPVLQRSGRCPARAACVRCAGAPDRVRLAGSHAADLAAPADTRGVREVRRVDAAAARSRTIVRVRDHAARTPTRSSACSRCGPFSPGSTSPSGASPSAASTGAAACSWTPRELVLDFVFDVVGVHRLEARAALQNGRGNGALHKLGATQEGVLQRSFLRNGVYLDQALWTILADDRRKASCVPPDHLVH